MTIKEVQSRVKAIISLTKEGSCDASTIDELGMLLMVDVIKAIAKGTEKPQELAKAYMKIYEFPFVEWLKNN